MVFIMSDTPLATARRYLKTIEDGTFADLQDLFTPDVTIEQLPEQIR